MVKIFTSQDVFIGEFDGMMTTEQLLSSGVPFSRIKKCERWDIDPLTARDIHHQGGHG